MLYLLYGTDSHKSRAKLHELLALATKKRPDAEVFKMTTENWNEADLEGLIGSQGLFQKKYTVVLDNVFENKEVMEFVLDRLPDLKSSEQIFLILESKILADPLKKFEKHAEKVQKFEKVEKKEKFNMFFVTDGLVEKDKKRLWVSYLDALSQGAEAEEIHGIFFWQVKSMLLAAKAKSQKETGLAPFPYSKALTGARKYKTEELLSMSSGLVDMTHRVRRGEGELPVMLEKWILER